MYRTILKLARTSQTNRESSLQMGMQIFRDDLFTHADKLHRHRGKLGDFKRQQVFLRFFYNSVHVDDRKLLGWAYTYTQRERLTSFLLLSYLWGVERALR